MASYPPFQVEDQTDEDFFDKLVDNDDEFKITESSPIAHEIADGNDSDEVKAFANLNVGESAVGSEDSGGEGRFEVKEEETIQTTARDLNAGASDAQVKESSSLVSSNSFGYDGVIESDSVIESNGVATEIEGTSDSTISGSNGSYGSGVKEVQWTAFTSNAGQNGNDGLGSYSDFFSELGDGPVDSTAKMEVNFSTEPKIGSGNQELKTANDGTSYHYGQYQENQTSGTGMEQLADGQDPNSSQYWENIYPGWNYDANTGQWYQVDGYHAANKVQGSSDASFASDWTVSNGNSPVSYLQQTAQSFVGTVTENGSRESVSNWNQLSRESGTSASDRNWNQGTQDGGSVNGFSHWGQVSHGSGDYPDHMVFDPQYPGWYYDTIAQEWRSLETYAPSVQSMVQAHDQVSQNGHAETGSFPLDNDKIFDGDHGQVEHYGSQGFSVQSLDNSRAGSIGNYDRQNFHIWQPETVSKSEAQVNFSGNQQFENGSKFSASNHFNHQKAYDSLGTVSIFEEANQVQNDFTTGSQGHFPAGNFNRQVDQTKMQQAELMHASNNSCGNQNLANFSQQQLQDSHQFAYAPTAGRSSAGRPPHALVTFGFGGKLIVMKDSSALNTLPYGTQGHLGGSISVLNLMEVVTERVDGSCIGASTSGYFNALCRLPFPGPLVGGNVGNKELNKWIDERIANCGSPDMDFRKGEVLRLLLSLLKIACQYYGKLRSPFGTDAALRESDAPESAVAKLFSSAKRNGVQFNNFDAPTHCLQKLPSEERMRATAAEVQSLLVSGRKKEALHCANEGQLWGPALVLAAQLGDQFYIDTVKKMALRQLVAGSPLRTLCLLIAGQPAEVFSTDTMDSGIPGAVNMSPRLPQCGDNSMLDHWEENLAVITANRTKDDELVLIHLGDCLWKDRSEITAAHICYLVAEANFESYSDSARLCLIGADHWKFPRTYASPDAIQRTALYEYSKALGNPQFILLPFQPYKYIYAHMLAEVGKITESLKYCQATLKSLKTGRAPEVDSWRQLVSSLEERLRAHQQGGFSTNLAPGKLVGKLLNLFDSTAHRVVGGLPPPAPSTSQGSTQANGNYYQMTGSRVSTSQSTMAMSSLMPTASMDPINDWSGSGNRMTVHNRSISEPNFGRTPIQDQDSPKEVTSSSEQGKASVSGGSSRFGHFGSQLLQKTVGLVLKPRQDRQAKLGETNKFYYDEKLKRWVEEGAEPPAEEASLPPPPKTAVFQNGTSDYNLSTALKSGSSPSNLSSEFTSPTPSEHNSGIPPIPPSTNQFSARGRTGVRSRYVDTFNKGGGNPTNLFPSPSVPTVKPVTGGNPKFFVPSPVSSSEQKFDATADTVQDTSAVDQNSLIITGINSFHSATPAPKTMQRFQSMDNISTNLTVVNGNSSPSSLSRRTASWSGSFSDPYKSPQKKEVKPLGEVLGMPPSSFMPNLGDELHEVQL
ncbi:hypothetical protein NMG60_11027316 [Bertholletia excelsa]